MPSLSTALPYAALAASIAAVAEGRTFAATALAAGRAATVSATAEWSTLPKMILERQFAGPLQDTVIQRLRDPVDGTICYLYLPISAPYSPTTATGFVQ